MSYIVMLRMFDRYEPLQKTFESDEAFIKFLSKNGAYEIEPHERGGYQFWVINDHGRQLYMHATLFPIEDHITSESLNVYSD